MSKLMYLNNIDLQLFAGEEDDEELDLGFLDDEEPEEDVDDSGEEEPETDDDQEEDEEEPEKHQAVPLSKYMKEKKQRQELERLLAQQKLEKEKIDIRNDYISRGWPEFEAEKLASKEINEKANQAKIDDKLRTLEIKDLARSEEFFSDAMTYEEDIKDIMAEKGVDAESAYMMLRGKVRRKEIQTKTEQRNLARRSNGKKVNNATSSAPKSQYKLDDDDKRALKQLQQVQPDAGWTAEKYFKIMKS